ncbi:MAG: DUF3800 domain-containing protein [Candidatus Pacebacteria bacterium]|nr:DUF3800 domain-containing protein [Candidatus Paceibacterota bacterium]
MKNYKIIALDETGKASMNHQSKTFILSGLILKESYQKELEKEIKGLKKKYFNNNDIVLHCRDMIRKKGPFACFRKDPDMERDFWKDLINIIEKEELSLAFVVTNKEKAKKLGWNSTAILRRSYNKILEEFVKNYLSDNKGKILVESDPSQDKYLIEAHNRLQGMGLPSEGISGFEYRQRVTSINFVNKLNFDSEIQLADTLAIMASLFYDIKMGKKNNDDITIIEQMMNKTLLDKKIEDQDSKNIFEILV